MLLQTQVRPVECGREAESPAGANYPGELVEGLGASLLGSAHPGQCGALHHCPGAASQKIPAAPGRLFPAQERGPGVWDRTACAGLTWFQLGWGFPVGCAAPIPQ